MRLITLMIRNFDCLKWELRYGVDMVWQVTAWRSFFDLGRDVLCGLKNVPVYGEKMLGQSKQQCRALLQVSLHIGLARHHWVFRSAATTREVAWWLGLRSAVCTGVRWSTPGCDT